MFDNKGVLIQFTRHLLLEAGMPRLFKTPDHTMLPVTQDRIDNKFLAEFKKDFSLFNEIFVNEIIKICPDLPKTTLDRLKRMVEYNVPHGKLNRGLMVIEAFLEFRSGQIVSKDELMQASCLGWCIEWLQAFFLVADDVMDSSLTRRGQPCWFRQADVGLLAINDALILRSGLSLLLRNQFGNDEIYFKFSELFKEVELSTEMGQLLDGTSFDFDDKSQDLMERYNLITKYKTSIYSFYLPFACAYLLSNQNSKCLNEELRAEHEILLTIGHLFQVQDDILDVYGDPQTTGKIGTDIEEGKFTWLLCKCLSFTNLTQSDRALLKTSRNSKIVKEIYDKHRIYDHFQTFESEMKLKIETSTLKLSRDSSSRIMGKYLKMIMKRIK